MSCGAYGFTIPAQPPEQTLPAAGLFDRFYILRTGGGKGAIPYPAFLVQEGDYRKAGAGQAPRGAGSQVKDSR